MPIVLTPFLSVYILLCFSSIFSSAFKYSTLNPAALAVSLIFLTFFAVLVSGILTVSPIVRFFSSREFNFNKASAETPNFSAIEAAVSPFLIV